MKVIINGKYVPLGGNNDTSSDDSSNTDFEVLFLNYILYRGRSDKISREDAEEFIKENILKKEKEEEEKKKLLDRALEVFQNFIKSCQTKGDEEKRKKYLEEALNKMQKEMGLEGKEPDGGLDGY